MPTRIPQSTFKCSVFPFDLILKEINEKSSSFLGHFKGSYRLQIFLTAMTNMGIFITVRRNKKLMRGLIQNDNIKQDIRLFNDNL